VARWWHSKGSVNKSLEGDLSAFIGEWKATSISDKYFLAQLNKLTSSIEATEWQVSGNSREANTSLKGIAIQLLRANRDQLDELKAFRGEASSQHAQLIAAFKSLAAATSGLPERTSAPSGTAPAFPPGLPPQQAMQGSPTPAYGQPGSGSSAAPAPSSAPAAPLTPMANMP